MPYIKKEQRMELLERLPNDVGELNYCINKIIVSYIEEKGENYQTYNDIMGVLACVQHELYRRKVGPYEDVKIEENGDLDE